MAGLQQLKHLKKVVGVEIYLPYIWKTKFSILSLHLQKKSICKPDVYIHHADVFSYDFKALSTTFKESEILIIGNPPWVTNAELGTINSDNLPKKSNFKKHSGIDAITGKGNFDIGEYISLMMLKSFQHLKGDIAFLVKNSVTKNILFDQKERKYSIQNLKKYSINAKKEFNVAVDASLFCAQLNADSPSMVCQEINFYEQEKKNIFGWYNDKFVFSIQKYQEADLIDGESSFVWRQGVKHDCSKIMELNRVNGHFVNGFKEEVLLEKDLLHGLLKSSDLKNLVVSNYRKTTIITQKKVGQNTNYIKDLFPKTYQYLDSKRAFFDKRKSSIYKNKPPFSIFGIGNYSFAPYKVAISGMYKRTTFSLVLPEDGKPLMLDDTCYFIGFDNLKDAKIAQYLLNSETVQQFLNAIIFPDAKRSITKDVLMRIDLKKTFDLLELATFDDINQHDFDVFATRYLSDTCTIKQMSLF